MSAAGVPTKRKRGGGGVDGDAGAVRPPGSPLVDKAARTPLVTRPAASGIFSPATASTAAGTAAPTTAPAAGMASPPPTVGVPGVAGSGSSVAAEEVHRHIIQRHRQWAAERARTGAGGAGTGAGLQLVFTHPHAPPTTAPGVAVEPPPPRTPRDVSGAPVHASYAAAVAAAGSGGRAPAPAPSPPSVAPPASVGGVGAASLGRGGSVAAGVAPATHVPAYHAPRVVKAEPSPAYAPPPQMVPHHAPPPAPLAAPAPAVAPALAAPAPRVPVRATRSSARVTRSGARGKGGRGGSKGGGLDAADMGGLLDDAMFFLPDFADAAAAWPFSGAWRLDKASSESMQRHLLALGVDGIAVQAADKLDIVLVVEQGPTGVTVTKRSQLGTKTCKQRYGEPWIETADNGTKRQSTMEYDTDNQVLTNEVRFTLRGRQCRIVDTRTLSPDSRVLMQRLDLHMPSAAVVTTLRRYNRTSREVAATSATTTGTAKSKAAKAAKAAAAAAAAAAANSGAAGVGGGRQLAPQRRRVTAADLVGDADIDAMARHTHVHGRGGHRQHGGVAPAAQGGGAGLHHGAAPGHMHGGGNGYDLAFGHDSGGR